MAHFFYLIYEFFYEILKKYYLNRYNNSSSKTEQSLTLVSNEQEKKLERYGYNLPIPFQLSFKTSNNIIFNYGCYFLSICFLSLVLKEVKLKIDKCLDSNEVSLIFKGIILDQKVLLKNSYVKNPDGILELLGVSNDIEFLGIFGKDYIEANDEFSISMYEFNKKTHFVVTDKSRLIWDSLLNSLVFKKGNLVSKRIFKIKNPEFVSDFRQHLNIYNRQFLLLRESL